MPQSTFRILVSDALSTEGIALLKESPGFDVDVHVGLKENQLIEIIGQYDALLVRSSTQVNARVIEHATKLKVVGRAGIGVDNVDVKAALAANILVMNTPDGNAVTTAEHAISLLMSLARHIPQANASLKEGKWEKSKYKGTEIHNKVLGIVGFGNIGRIVAVLAKGLRMEVIAHDPFASHDHALELAVPLVELDELFARADFISLHAPLTSSTHHLLNERAFAKMKKGVFIINAARGGIVDEQALLAVLESGQVKGAALDVFEEEPPAPGYTLLAHPRVIATPHLGASTDEAQNRVALQIAEQVRDYLINGQVRNRVNG
jgi:D-3-phosphoglycerate dehydrogenase